MKYFLLHKNGTITVVGTLEENSTEVDLLTMEETNPGVSAAFISEGDYNRVCGFGEYFNYINNELIEKSQAERDSIDNGKNLLFNL